MPNHFPSVNSMQAVPVVSIFDVSTRREGNAAVADWQGFAEFRPGETSRPGPDVLVLEDAPDALWTWRSGMTPKTIKPLGCHFLRDIEIQGVGFPFLQGHYILEHVHTSDVGRQWLDHDTMSENPRLAPPANRLVIDEPVLLVFGPGFPVFGHWLLDFLPRVEIAKGVLGDAFAGMTILLPDDTPDFVRDMMRFFCGVRADQIRTFSCRNDMVVCSRVCLPSFAHNGDYVLHSFMREFYNRFRPSPAKRAHRKICLSRRTYEKTTRSAWRVFETREAFERMAIERGYEIVQPELLDFAGQIELFHSAETIIGEHGSGMHAAIFSRPGTIVATFPALNAIQLQIGAECGHTNIWLNRHAERHDARGVYYFEVTEEDLLSMLSVVDQARSQRDSVVQDPPGRRSLSGLLRSWRPFLRVKLKRQTPPL
nr:glycosyltransferase 61 family protein [uncultured Rhodopila sp.]